MSYVYNDKMDKGHITTGGGWFAWGTYDSDGLQNGYSKAHLELCDEDGYGERVTLCGVDFSDKWDTADPHASYNCKRCEKISERIAEGGAS